MVDPERAVGGINTLLISFCMILFFFLPLFNHDKTPRDQRSFFYKSVLTTIHPLVASFSETCQYICSFQLTMHVVLLDRRFGPQGLTMELPICFLFSTTDFSQRKLYVFKGFIGSMSSKIIC